MIIEFMPYMIMLENSIVGNMKSHYDEIQCVVMIRVISGCFLLCCKNKAVFQCCCFFEDPKEVAGCPWYYWSCCCGP